MAAVVVVAPFVLASVFPIVKAIPLERRENSTASRGFEGPTQFGPWTVPFWAYILIVGLIITASIGLLVFLVNFLLSISCWTLCYSVNTLLAEKTEQRREKKAHQTAQTHTQPPQPQPPPEECHDSPTHGTNTAIYDHPHIRTYSTHSNNSAYAMNQARTGNIAPYHQYTLPDQSGAADPYTYSQRQRQWQHNQQHQQQQQRQQQQYQLKRTGPEAFAFPLVPTSMLPPNPPPLLFPGSFRPSSELSPIGPYPPRGLEHKYGASH